MVSMYYTVLADYLTMDREDFIRLWFLAVSEHFEPTECLAYKTLFLKESSTVAMMH